MKEWLLRTVNRVKGQLLISIFPSEQYSSFHAFLG
jgi:hypothetical protein